jgi:hypothetical protein
MFTKAKSVVVVLLLSVLAACGSTGKGAAIGAGISAATGGDMGKGAAMGAGVGAVVDIID